MGDVIPLAQARARRTQRTRQAMVRAVRHPALRWVAGDVYWVAHRRDPADGLTACGKPGPLTLAPPGVPLCPACYPPDQ